MSVLRGVESLYVGGAENLPDNVVRTFHKQTVTAFARDNQAAKDILKVCSRIGVTKVEIVAYDGNTKRGWEEYRNKTSTQPYETEPKRRDPIIRDPKSKIQ